MKVKKSDRDLLIQVWGACAETLIDNLEDYKKELLATVDAHDFQIEMDFRSFAKQAFLHRVKSFYDHHNPLEETLREAQKIIQSDD